MWEKVVEMNIKSICRASIRWALRIRDQETIEDGLVRHRYRFLRHCDKRSFGPGELKEALGEMGVKPGDSLMVHASWRAAYGYSGSPQSFVGVLLDCLGEEGTLLMPAYSSPESIFDVEESKSTAGVLSEIFRNMDGVKRSAIPHFPVCAKGALSDELFRQENTSAFGFDESSPYSRFVDAGGKVLLVGLPRNTWKISCFHVSVWRWSHKKELHSGIYNPPINTTIVQNGEPLERELIVKAAGMSNDHGAFSKAFSKVDKRCRKLGGCMFTVFGAREAVEIGVGCLEDGMWLYKGMRNL